MTKDQALQAIALLSAGTTGWDEEASAVYVERCAQLTSFRTLVGAVRKIIDTWKEARRPPLALVLETYQALLPPPPLAIGTDVCDPARGKQIAMEIAVAEGASEATLAKYLRPIPGVQYDDRGDPI